MARILVVEDDEQFRQSVCALLKKKGLEIIEASSGKVGRDILSIQDVDIVLTDVQMPGISGVELLEWSKQNKPVPFIMMTGFSMLLETKSAFELGAKEFLTKPFKTQELFAVIDRILNLKADEQPPEKPAQDIDFCRVSIDDFVSRQTVDFAVYIRLFDDKYVKIAHQGDGIPVDRLEHYKTKGLKYLYIPREDFGKLVDFTLVLANAIKDAPGIDAAKKAKFLKYTGEILLEKAFVDGVDKKSFTDANQFMGVMLETLADSPEQLDLLSLLSEHSNAIYAHSLGVAMHCHMVATQLEYESSQTLFKLCTAGIYHDIGKKEIDAKILEKPRALLSSDERKQVETHVTRGQEILNSIRGIPEDVVQLVYEHHEDLAEQGYPNRKPKKDLHPLSRVLLTVNIFVEYALKTPSNKGMEGFKAIEHIERIFQAGSIR